MPVLAKILESSHIAKCSMKKTGQFGNAGVGDDSVTFQGNYEDSKPRLVGQFSNAGVGDGSVTFHSNFGDSKPG